MNLTKQSQEAGNFSTQIQAQNVTNNYFVGVSEERAREIYRQEYERQALAMIEEARELAESRILKLEDKIFPKMMEYDKTLQAFSDPSFQRSLTNAQRAAACSDKEQDLDLIAELLIERIKNPNKRSHKLAINKIIEVVDQIPDDALTGLLLFYAFGIAYNISGNPREKCAKFNEIIESLIGDVEWPSGSNWLDCLDMLNLIRMNPSGVNSFKKFEAVLLSMFQKSLVKGLKEDDPTLETLKKEISDEKIPTTFLKSYPLKAGYIWADLPAEVDQLVITSENEDGTISKRPLTVKQRQIIKKAVTVVNVPDPSNTQLKNELLKIWNEFPMLRKWTEWWNNLNLGFSLTMAGSLLGEIYFNMVKSKDNISSAT